MRAVSVHTAKVRGGHRTVAARLEYAERKVVMTVGVYGEKADKRRCETPMIKKIA